jgi:hypothetical protein
MKWRRISPGLLKLSIRGKTKRSAPFDTRAARNSGRTPTLVEGLN